MHQHSITLPAMKRGYHLITEGILEAVPHLSEFKTGMCQVFIQHTSASLTINEDADPTVRKDFETIINKLVPENDKDYIHNTEGSDDMPAHVKSSLLGASVLIPVNSGRLALGTWQGIYLCEHRNHGSQRHLVITIWGEPFQ
ncbi:MAG: secondary thiamine-phosphate synthase enzyme YjbQ [Ginsengibacter sp.]